ncbi:MAG TPA: hypothetical protein VJ777_30180 [Mycobacterium sp.]|nr:hypothetical protein [Mycobacterium sp.]
MTGASAQDWYRFLDVVTGEDAASELHRLVVRLETVHGDLEAAASALSDAPEGDVSEALWIARTGLTDAIDRLELAGARFWPSQYQSA